MEIASFITRNRNKSQQLADYGATRAQLSRRLLTVRRKLGRTSPKGKQYAPAAKITAEDIANNHEFVQFLLLLAERAWAQAMHMKSAHSSDTATQGITGPTRRHIISRLYKASMYAKQLLNLLEERSTAGANEVDILEARAYCGSLEGAVQFEKQSWKSCLECYSQSRVIYDVLAVSIKHEYHRELLSSTVDPSIRYAAYQSHIPRSIAESVIARRHFPRSDANLIFAIEQLHPGALSEHDAASKSGSVVATNDIPKTISWRSRTVGLEDASIAQALASVATAEDQLSQFLQLPTNTATTAKEKAAAYDGILIASQDAVDAARRAIEDLVEEGVGQGDKRMQALQITRTAVNYSLVGWRVGRNRVLCGEQDGAVSASGTLKKKDQKKDSKKSVSKEEGQGKELAYLKERVVLYDAILQSIDSVMELPGVAGDQEFVVELESKRAYFQALKCLSIARSHVIVSKPKNALALISRSLNLSTRSLVQSSLSKPSSQGSPPNLDVSHEQAKTLNELLHSLELQYRALVNLSDLSASVKSMSSPRAPLVELLTEYPSRGVELNNLVNYPPKLKPVPVKPLFLDVAWNYIEYPGRVKTLTEDKASRAKEPATEKGEDRKERRKGWFGFGR
ncbi:MAG: hypothetical protein M1835_007642 [Candelina submexicana]|nr:MAG: hypothetical protein M1835_007642 [Candelina submexicana]